MSSYKPNDFINALIPQINGKQVPNCRYCGGSNFTTTEDFATILVGKEMNSISIGPSIPAGMLVCEKCGHIEFFALGALGILNNKDGQNNGEQKN